MYEFNQTVPLTERERKVLRLRFAIDQPNVRDSVAKESYDVIGAEIGVSRERVRQIQHEALAKLGIKKPEVWPTWSEMRTSVMLAKTELEYEIEDEVRKLRRDM